MQKIVPPTHCPSCDSELELVNDQLFCRDSGCPAQTAKKVEHYAKTVKIKGLGPKTIEKIEFEDISEIYKLDREFYVDLLGKALGNKLMDEIEKSKEQPLSTFISAFSIPLIGKTAGDKLAQVTDNIDAISYEMCKTAGLGDKAATNLCDWLATEWEEVYKFLPVKIIKSKLPAPSLGISVVLTGKIPGYTRPKLTEELKTLGFEVKSSVSSKTDYVLAGSNRTQSSTEKKAEGLGIPIVNSLEELVEASNSEK